MTEPWLQVMADTF